ncbi:MAG: LytTR family transcriptional regulator DNA-binding domain-containing protein [Bacteroidetes bacterium]|nr:LytTR family transcriptional regulator DNA-binding domain-containing protein [Bacteroidota bacterium]
MQQAKIGIVEDELIIADSIRSVLLHMSYRVPEPCSDYNEAIMMLHSEQPDLVLLDINLANRQPDGIAVARYIREHLDMPFIFLTANSDAATLERAKTVNPNAFLVKPFQRDDLYAAIEIAMHNFYSSGKATQGAQARQYLFIKEGALFHKVNFDEILYIESDHVYVSIYTVQRRYLVRTSLQQYHEELDKTVFVRIHRSYIVNKHKIDSVAPAHLIMGNKILPISRKYRDALLELL